jgi:hypothetical protein
MVATGRAVGVDAADPGDPVPYISYYSMKPKDPTSVNCSPRYSAMRLSRAPVLSTDMGC